MARVELVLPLAAALLAAVADVVAKQLLDDTDAASFLVLSFAWISVLVMPLVFVSFNLSRPFVAAPLLCLIFSLDALANLLYFRAMEVQDVSRLAVFGGMAPVFTLLTATVFLPSHLSLELAAVVALVAAAAYLLNADGPKPLEPLRGMVERRNYEALLSAVLFGASAIPTRYALSEMALTNPVTLYWMRALVIGAVLLAVLRPSLGGIGRRSVVVVGARAVLVVGYWLALLRSISQSNVISSVALSRTTPVFTLLLGWIVLGEDLDFRKIVSVGLVMGAIALLETTPSTM
jgi:drug/metabolite transporter (DMT)-like permease